MRENGGNKMTEDGNGKKMCIAEPAALGLFGLGLVTLVASTGKLGWTEGTMGMLPWVFFFGRHGNHVPDAGDRLFSIDVECAGGTVPRWGRPGERVYPLNKHLG